ncbi:hypothetical protein [Gluconobacter morbifer]|uniref:Lipoprotein n=1 Tax=Gluconobacter morbifer G707 TaxID=1088869 RepID=G6XI06_9PROT|nr:hypothetical protein [Gluconobacter morbifer]EHH68446.1 hypothetical protein GMO_12160 [Gluconobacter morbifer G707]
MKTSLRHRIFRKAVLLVLGGGLLSSCAIHPQIEGVAPSPNARLYSYLIVHGMARGAIMTRQITPENIRQLVALDRNAQIAAINAMRLQNRAGNRQADATLEDLLKDISQPPSHGVASTEAQKNRQP